MRPRDSDVKGQTEHGSVHRSIQQICANAPFVAPQHSQSVQAVPTLSTRPLALGATEPHPVAVRLEASSRTMRIEPASRILLFAWTSNSTAAVATGSPAGGRRAPAERVNSNSSWAVSSNRLPPPSLPTDTLCESARSCRRRNLRATILPYLGRSNGEFVCGATARKINTMYCQQY